MIALICHWMNCKLFKRIRSIISYLPIAAEVALGFFAAISVATVILACVILLFLYWYKP